MARARHRPVALWTPAVAGRAAAPVRDLWDRLATPAAYLPAFEPALVAGLPEPARRHLLASIAVGTPLATIGLLEMEGRIRIGRWLPFRASQVLAPGRGFVWAARAGWGPVSVRGFDRYGDGTGEMQWRLAGLAPLIQARGVDIDRSAAGRLAAESALVPTSLLDPSITWEEGAERDTVRATWRIADHVVPVTLHVTGDGALAEVTMMRWGKPAGAALGHHPFAAVLSEPVAFGGITIPTRWQVGWFHGTPRGEEGRFFEAHVTAARFL